ncbi:MAG TPA: D-cysteine desulfhydrase family protein [Vicinamibacteria bacterium]|jgi:1-aminocyclopropane-1-carboxylate deaminase/D-cysteine desulfhydrase-like pyridoxal-dependent ACC family enzyme
MRDDDALAALNALPSAGLVAGPTPVEEMSRLRDALGGGPRLLVKRDDALPFGFGGNKVRKLDLVAARALAEDADTLLTVGGVQSNHARATAAAAARLGLRCVLILNGARPDRLTGNTLLDGLLGAEIEYVSSRDERASAMGAAADRLRAQGRRPFEIPLGASTPLGAMAYARAIAELAAQIPAPDVIVHASSSGGTQAGLIAGSALLGLPTRVLGISADDPAPALEGVVGDLVSGIDAALGAGGRLSASAPRATVDDSCVGEGYGIPTPASREATQLAARTEALFLDPTYTAKAMAGLIAHLRAGRFRPDETVLFWHTGGQVGLVA